MAAQPSGATAMQPVQAMQPLQQHPLAMNSMAIKVALPSASDWSLDEDKILENTLAECWEGPDRLEAAARRLPSRTLDQVQHRFRLLEEDVTNIDAGRIPLPNYASAQEHTSLERRKGIPWTEEEHRLFLMGLAKFGKGDWRSISRNYVISRTPTQVASHAQKYFIRLNSLNKKDKRRSSIHDITSPGGNTGEVTGLMPQAIQQNTGVIAVPPCTNTAPRTVVGMQPQMQAPQPPFPPQQQQQPPPAPQTGQVQTAAAPAK